MSVTIKPKTTNFVINVRYFSIQSFCFWLFLNMVTTCAGCAKNEVNMMVCSKCKIVSYCSKDCQKLNWEQHKQQCCKVTPSSELVPCAHCSLRSASSLKCGRCKCRRYCSHLCQKKDWQLHKIQCNPETTKSIQWQQQLVSAEKAQNQADIMQYSRKLLKCGYKLAVRLNETGLQRFAHSQIGMNYLILSPADRTIRRLERAENHLNRALTIRLQHEQADLDVYGNLGHVLFGLSRYAESLSSYQKQLNLAVKYHNAEQIGRGYCGMGNVFQKQGRLEESMAALQKARLYVSSNEIADIDCTLGHIYLDQKNYSQALSCFIQSFNGAEGEEKLEGLLQEITKVHRKMGCSEFLIVEIISNLAATKPLLQLKTNGCKIKSKTNK